MPFQEESDFFVGREKEVGELQSAFLKRRHLVLSGDQDIGKSALLTHVAQFFPLLVCDRPLSVEQCCEDLAKQLDLRLSSHPTEEHIRIVVAAINKARATVAFDSFDQPPGDVITFVGELAQTCPIWIVTRSAPSQGLGIIGEHFPEFMHLGLGPLKRTDVRVLIARATAKQTVRSFTVHQADTFYRLCNGNPLLLQRLLRFVMLHKPEDENSLERCLDLWQKSNGSN